MSKIKRRHFLQFAGSALAAIGLSQLDLQRQGLRYGKVLAQSTPRKLALLVGINQYPDSKRFRDLSGCVQDVELQKNLLKYRFGFQESDILTLTNAQATRKGIIEAFDRHLIQQAKPGDVVVFHFSGHGSLVNDPSPIDPNFNFNGTFVPADDSPLEQQGIVNDIMGQTLFLLMYALGKKTENVTVVLDSCHSGAGTRGEAIVRAAEPSEKASDEEFALQQKLLAQLSLTPEQFQAERNKGVAAGTIVASAKRDQLAADYRFGDFHAGAFTFLLTQYLWQQTGDVESAIAALQNRIRPLSNQLPLYEVKPGSNNQRKPIYFLNPPSTPAEAVILKVENNKATLWMGGVDQNSLDAFGEGAVFTPVTAARGQATEIQITSRQGLLAQATIEGSAQPGDFLQESARAIPSEWKLGIGIDPSLSAEGSSVAAALQQLNRIEAIPAQTHTTSASQPYAQKVHYILSRMTPTYRQQLQESGAKNIPGDGGVGLFSSALEIVPKSFGTPGETIPEAMKRLEPKIMGLLAARIIKLTLNADSSQLAVGVSMIVGGNTLVGEAFTPRGCAEPKECQSGVSRGSGPLLQQLPLNKPFQFEIINNEAEPLYIGVLVIDASGEITVLFPNQFQEGLSKEELEGATRIAAKSKLSIPGSNDPFALVPEETGVGEVLVVASQTPMSDALLRLRSLAGGNRGPVGLAGERGVDVVNDLLGDVSTRGLIGVKPVVSTSKIAALSISFEVVPG
jgi:Caspase domain/Domain of unknown function (DUF4384)